MHQESADAARLEAAGACGVCLVCSGQVSAYMTRLVLAHSTAGRTACLCLLHPRSDLTCPREGFTCHVACPAEGSAAAATADIYDNTILENLVVRLNSHWIVLLGLAAAAG